MGGSHAGVRAVDVVSSLDLAPRWANFLPCQPKGSESLLSVSLQCELENKL